MVNCGNLLKSVLVAVILVAVAESGQGEEKLATCCEQVTNAKITEPILGFLVQKANPPCVKAVIFQTESGLYCINGNAPWVRPKIIELMNAKPKSTAPSAVTSSPVSLLSIITSSLPSSSIPLSSSTASPATSSK